MLSIGLRKKTSFLLQRTFITTAYLLWWNTFGHNNKTNTQILGPETLFNQTCIFHRKPKSSLPEVPSAELQCQHSSLFDLRLLPTSFSFFGRDSFNEVFVLCLKLQTPSKRSSVKTLPSSASWRNLWCTNFHWISGMLRLNGLVF